VELSSEIESLLGQGGVDMTVSLCTVAASGNHKLMEQLLSQGANPNTTDYSGRTPLVIAAAMGHYGCVSLLLDHGADINSAGMSRIVLQIKTIELVPLKITVSKFGIDMLEVLDLST
jgi:ankyrin repeat protein